LKSCTVDASLMQVKIPTNRFRVADDSKINLKDWSTDIKPLCPSKECFHDTLREHTERLDKLQQRLFADNKKALLLIFQAMDAAGKDGAIRHVMSGVNPQGCQVYSFKKPSTIELAHDFLWRAARVLPERGHIGIFNRSYYEEVLVVRVHEEILGAENVPDDEKIWKHRYDSIRHFEQHLYRNGTHVIKFFLHVSKEEQKERLLARIDDPAKNWKFSADDIRERGFWKSYMKAYAEAISATSTEHCPWYIVPADHKANARLIVSQVILDTMEALNPDFPKVPPARRKELLHIREQLLKS
jgi:PPK2 family polyphosphate:nucleotide phosphotransferase